MPKPIDDKIVSKFWRLVDKGTENQCWEWVGHRLPKGYGTFGLGKDSFYAHRVSWIVAYGDIPSGMMVLHKCDNPPCCNPHHLFLGTNDDNMKDRDEKGRVAKGEKNGMAKLSKLDVQEIRRQYSTGTTTQKELGSVFGVTRSTIGFIVNDQRWRQEEE